MLNQNFIVIKNFFSIRLVHNTGAAFSILSGKVDFLIIITAIALAAIAFFVFTHKFDNKFEEITALMIFEHSSLSEIISSICLVGRLQFSISAALAIALAASGV